MIKLPSDYDSARSYGGGYRQLPPGGHICKILDAGVEKSRSGRDMLVVSFDIHERGEFDGHYKERHERALKYRKDAKWPGVFRTTILNSAGKTNGFFKGLIEAVEDSNPGYNFKDTGADSQTLKGKLVGFNFGEEEYERRDAAGFVSTAVSVKPAYAVSVARVKEGVAPPPIKTLGNPAAASSVQREASYQAAPDDPPF